MPSKLLVINVVGLTPGLMGEDTPHLSRLAQSGFQSPMKSILPAVTCSAQATMLTGQLPRTHGIVANGWYFRDLSEIWLWRQSNRLVQAPKVWEKLRQKNPKFTCAKLFWWYNMYSSADWSVTPRPVYHADGKKSPSIYTEPASIKDELERDLGPFPLFDFWGPRAGLPSSAWIQACSKKMISDHQADLTLVYLPHLDYDFQRFGPHSELSKKAVREVDALCGDLILHAQKFDMEVLVVSEYGITEVTQSVSINRVLREEGYLRTQSTIAGELLDAGASKAFALSDHQVAHVYVQDKQAVSSVKNLLESIDGIERVLDEDGKREQGLDHERSGELIAISEANRWFDYYYWTDDAQAPDFARTVDIHKKPGYDPAELVLDSSQPAIKAKILFTLLKKKLGFRTLLDVIPLHGNDIRGSHGRIADHSDDGPIIISSNKKVQNDSFEMTQVAQLIEEICNL